MIKGIDFTGIAVAFLCHDGQGNYVMHRRSQNCRDEHGCWDFGGGGVKFGELLEDCLKREVKEEYDADILDSKFLGHRELLREHNGGKTHWLCFYYQVLVSPEQVINNEPEKHDELCWFRFDDLPQPLHSMIPGDIEMYKNKL